MFSCNQIVGPSEFRWGHKSNAFICGRKPHHTLKTLEVSAVRKAVKAKANSVFTEVRPIPQDEALVKNLTAQQAQALQIASSLVGAATGFLSSKVLPAAIKQYARYPLVLAFAYLAYVASGKLAEKRSGGACVALEELLVSMNNPGDLQREDVEAIEKEYGLSLGRTRPAFLEQLYGQYLQRQLPVTLEPLSGAEADELKSFGYALGLSDDGMAQAHMKYGQTLNRGRIEVGIKSTEGHKQKMTLHRLIYLSDEMFGVQRSLFLLPWKRVLNISPEALVAARTDNARALFANRLAQFEGVPTDRDTLEDLRQFQQKVRLSDGAAKNVLKAATLQNCKETLIGVIRNMKIQKADEDIQKNLQVLQQLLDNNKTYNSLASSEQNVEEHKRVLPCGLASASMIEDSVDPILVSDLRDTYRFYMEKCIARDGVYSDRLAGDLGPMRSLLGLSEKVCGAVEVEVAEDGYKQRLRNVFIDGSLKESESPAAVLESLVVAQRINPETAKQMHVDIYRQRIGQLTEDNKLSEEAQSELEDMQRMLCLSVEEVRQVRAETVGLTLKATIQELISVAPQSFSSSDVNLIVSQMRSLQIDKATAYKIMEPLAKQKLLEYVQKAKQQAVKNAEAARNKEVQDVSDIGPMNYYRDMVVFSSNVLTRLLAVIPSPKAAAMKEFQDIMAQAQAEASGQDSEASTDGEAPAVEVVDMEDGSGVDDGFERDGSFDDGLPDMKTALPHRRVAMEGRTRMPKQVELSGKKQLADKAPLDVQADIQIGDEMTQEEKKEVYKQYVVSAARASQEAGLSGAMGKSDFENINQFAVLMGLGQEECDDVNRELSEQIFKIQVDQIMQKGSLTVGKLKEIGELQKQFNVSDDFKNRVVRGIQTEVSEGQASQFRGQVDMDYLNELEKGGESAADVIPYSQRVSFYKREALKQVESGTGTFDTAQITQTLPRKLGLAPEKADKLLKDLVKGKSKYMLVTAVSAYRQKKAEGLVTSLNNLVSLYSADPSLKEQDRWTQGSELGDMYQYYIGEVGDEELRGKVAKVLGLGEEERKKLEEAVVTGVGAGQAGEADAGKTFF